MATLTFTMKYQAVVSGKGATATCPVTLNYTTSSNNTTFTMTTTSFTVGAVSSSGDIRAQGQARMGVINALASGGAECLFNGAQVFKRTDLSPSTTYTASYSRSINRTTANQSIPLQFKGTYGSNVANLSVTARPSWDVTYSANSGSGAPATQKKYYDYNLTLSSGRPTKANHTFLGWATSTTIAGAGTVNYNPSQTYTANAGLNLYAVWERNYQKPTLGNLHIDRCQQDGTLDDDGTYAKVSFDWDVFRTADARYYGGSTTPYADNAVDTCTVTVGTQSATPTLTGQSGTASVIVGNGTFDTDQAYTASVSITDTQTIKSDHTTTITGELSKAKFPIDINRDATAIAFLSTAPDDDEGVFCPDMTAQEIQDFVDNLEGGGIDFTRIKRKLLWTNTTYPFASQTVSLALSEYDYVEVWFASAIGAVDAMLPNPLEIPLDERREIVYFHGLGDGGANENTGMRGVTASSTGVTFGDYYYKNRRTGGGLTKANQFTVPSKIYGVKYY